MKNVFSGPDRLMKNLMSTISLAELSYWRMTDDKVEANYPKTYDIWRGIPEDIDAAFTSTARGGIIIILHVKNIL